MNRWFYPKMAGANIKKNGKFYFPYWLTFVCTVIMFYTMCYITFNKGLSELPGGESLKSILNLGCIVVGIFVVIFLFYTNSFLMKRRQKEIGLYNILGMEKKHIAKILFFETFYISVSGIAMGLLAGILFSRLMQLGLCRLFNFDVKIVFSISGKGLFMSVLLFGAVFILTLLSNMARIGLSKPIELLQGGNVGEKEPKTKWLLAVIGFVCIFAGYYIAITTKTPLAALLLFFAAVVLVIIGTYCLFTAGSIVILKLLRKNKNYYYQTSHFTAVSGMLYRMKQNAVGLANICILSTMVLVMVSTTVCLYLGLEKSLKTRYPKDISLSRKYVAGETFDADAYLGKIKNTIVKEGRSIKDLQEFNHLTFTVSKKGSQFIADTNNYVSASSSHVLVIFTAKEYEQLSGEKSTLNQNEVAVYCDSEQLDKRFELFEKTYIIKKKLKDFPVTEDNYAGYLANIDYIVVADETVQNELYQSQLKAYPANASGIQYEVSFNLDGTDEEKSACADKLKDLNDNIKCRQQIGKEVYATYGGFLFLGVFLGILFLMATVLIIYYKQISEGYDDKERFEIMQKVGMSRREVMKSINSQILLVFFLPLLTAVLHVAAAFPMIKRLLVLFNLTDQLLFAICTIVTILIFALIYGIVYKVTAGVYYKIVHSFREI